MLDQAQIDQFHREGFLLLRQVFGGDELELLRLAADRVQADGLAGRGDHHHYHLLPGGLEIYCRSEKMWGRDPIFPAAAAHPQLLEAVGQCLGNPFLPIADSLVCKTRFGKIPVPWHQDPPYHDPQQEHSAATPDICAGICLDQSTVENGCLWSLPGHHLVGHVDLQRYGEEELYPRARPLEMASGDLLLLAHSAPHGSRGNASPWTQRLFCVHFAAGKNPDGTPLARPMLAQRRTLGLANLQSTQVYLSEQGFTFTGLPCTPPCHWQTLIAQLSPDEIQRKKHLLP